MPLEMKILESREKGQGQKALGTRLRTLDQVAIELHKVRVRDTRERDRAAYATLLADQRIELLAKRGAWSREPSRGPLACMSHRKN